MTRKIIPNFIYFGVFSIYHKKKKNFKIETLKILKMKIINIKDLMMRIVVGIIFF